ncbi:hypothetical protein [Nonomuraea rubra]|uniref:Uncharacterized protein n=1 Tax=Nonomuraea rubra TaxID=46180 RepID=A0A7X0P717_9ACTN|nr:hypothetical protein [Nonomuraea rubra]MBB6556234.1 hypothetical protein [Nonomuraea rubra]
MSRLFARHTGRRCRRRWASHGSSTGWSALAQVVPAVEDVSRRRSTPLALCPVIEGDLIPYADIAYSPRYQRPYDSPNGSAA